MTKQYWLVRAWSSPLENSRTFILNTKSKNNNSDDIDAFTLLHLNEAVEFIGRFCSATIKANVKKSISPACQRNTWESQRNTKKPTSINVELTIANNWSILFALSSNFITESQPSFKRCLFHIDNYSVDVVDHFIVWNSHSIRNIRTDFNRIDRFSSLMNLFPLKITSFHRKSNNSQWFTWNMINYKFWFLLNVKLIPFGRPITF